MSALPADAASARPLHERLRAADPDAMGEAFRLHAPTLLRVSFALTGSVQEAEDIVQDLFVGLPEAIGKYDGTGSLDAWRRRVVARMALMRLRAGRRRDATAHSASAVDSSTGRLDAVLADRMTIAQALQALPDTLRAVVVLKDVEGYSHEEIARLLGIRPNTAAVRLHRARTLLRQLLKEDR